MAKERVKGTVKWFDVKKGYGFIEAETGQDVFVHYSAIMERGYRSIEKGDEVEFEIEENPKGVAARAVKCLSTKFKDVQRSS